MCCSRGSDATMFVRAAAGQERACCEKIAGAQVSVAVVKTISMKCLMATGLLCFLDATMPRAFDEFGKIRVQFRLGPNDDSAADASRLCAVAPFGNEWRPIQAHEVQIGLSQLGIRGNCPKLPGWKFRV